jgi:uncharacterized coiled-coil DUF342 family protein
MHDIIGFGTVLAAILAGILLNRNDVKELRAELRGEMKELSTKIDALRAEMKAKIDSLRAEMYGKIDGLRTEMHGEFERFYMALGQYAKIENLEKKAG